jgi:hypothetical protein
LKSSGINILSSDEDLTDVSEQLPDFSGTPTDVQGSKLSRNARNFINPRGIMSETS